MMSHACTQLEFCAITFEKISHNVWWGPCRGRGVRLLVVTVRVTVCTSPPLQAQLGDSAGAGEQSRRAVITPTL